MINLQLFCDLFCLLHIPLILLLSAESIEVCRNISFLTVLRESYIVKLGLSVIKSLRNVLHPWVSVQPRPRLFHSVAEGVVVLSLLSCLNLFRVFVFAV